MLQDYQQLACQSIPAPQKLDTLLLLRLFAAQMRK
jgi:hypothetical protein